MFGKLRRAILAASVNCGCRLQSKRVMPPRAPPMVEAACQALLGPALANDNLACQEGLRCSTQMALPRFFILSNRRNRADSGIAAFASNRENIGSA
jgi:hypothetical protein